MMLFRRRKNEKSNKAPEVSVLESHEGDTLETDGLKYAASSHIGTREYQQDFVETGIGKEGVVFGVLCDGMGGLDDGDFASRTAAQAMLSALSEMDPECDIHAYLVTQAQLINRLIFELPLDENQRGAAGTTLVAVVFKKELLYWLSVGDSRIYIIRKNEIVPITRNHSYSLELEQLIQIGKITEEEAANDPKRNALISYMGIEHLTIIDSNRNPFPLESGDAVLLCSDGLYNSLSDQEIFEILDRHNEDILECARVLPIYALDNAKGGLDNTSVILFRYQNRE